MSPLRNAQRKIRKFTAKFNSQVLAEAVQGIPNKNIVPESVLLSL